MLNRFLAALLALLFVLPVSLAADDDIVRLYTFSSGTTIQSSQVNSEFNQLINTMNGKASRSGVNTFSGNNTHSGTNTFSGINSFSHASSGIKTDYILEYTPAAGVTIDSVRLKDGMAKVAGTAASNGEIGYASNQFQGYRNGSLKNFLMAGDVGTPTVTARSSNTILGTSDANNAFIMTSTFTQTFTAAATLATGWVVEIKNAGTGIITLDPNASETIDGLTTMAMYPGEAFKVICDGSNFYTVGRQKGPIMIQTQSASASATIDFTTGFSDTEFIGYELRWDGLVSATDNTDLWFRISQDAGSTFKAGASDYSYTTDYVNTGATLGTSASTGDTKIIVQRQVDTTLTGANSSGSIRCNNLQSTALTKMFEINAVTNGDGAQPEKAFGWGYFKLNTNTAINGLRMMMASGNITSGTLSLWGIRK